MANGVRNKCKICVEKEVQYMISIQEIVAFNSTVLNPHSQSRGSRSRLQVHLHKSELLSRSKSLTPGLLWCGGIELYGEWSAEGGVRLEFGVWSPQSSAFIFQHPIQHPALYLLIYWITILRSSLLLSLLIDVH